MLNALNVIITVLSFASMILSITGAVKSNRYYNKNKDLITYTKTNVAVIEIQNIISVFPKILELASKANARGRNYVKELTKYGIEIKSSLNKIKEKSDSGQYKKIQEILISGELNVEKYIDSFISSDILGDGKPIIDDKFTECQNKINEIQLFLKEQLEETSKKLK